MKRREDYSKWINRAWSGQGWSKPAPSYQTRRRQVPERWYVSQWDPNAGIHRSPPHTPATILLTLDFLSFAGMMIFVFYFVSIKPCVRKMLLNVTDDILRASASLWASRFNRLFLSIAASGPRGRRTMRRPVWMAALYHLMTPYSYSYILMSPAGLANSGLLLSAIAIVSALSISSEMKLRPGRQFMNDVSKFKSVSLK